MPRAPRKNAALTERQRRRKEQILTQPSPAKVRETASAVVLKQGSLVLLSSEAGEVPEALPHGFGLFLEDCRFLDRYTLSVNGRMMTALSSADVRGFETHHQLANPELPNADGSGRIATNTVAVQRRRLLRGGVLHERIEVHNFGRAPVQLALGLRFRARFDDLFIVKGFLSGPRGRPRPPRVCGRDTVQLGYDGRDGVPRTTTVTSLATWATLPLVLPEARAAWRRLRGA